MLNSSFWHFLTLQLFRERKKHFATVVISTFLVFILASVLFIAGSLRHTLMQLVTLEPDFVVSRIQGGEPSATPLRWMDEILELHGVAEVTPRVYGRYFFTPKEVSFFLMGVDPLDEQTHRALARIMGDTMPSKAFALGESMLVGEGVKHFLVEHYYTTEYRFLTPMGKFLPLKIEGEIPKVTNLLSNDMVLLSLARAGEILGYGKDEVSDISFNVPNPDEWENIQDKVSALHYDLRVVSKREKARAYAHLFNYEEGLFLVLFLVLLATFLLTLYQRYSMVYSSEKRQIGLLRATGWSIASVLRLKLAESLVLILFSFILGVLLAYGYVFGLDAPWLRLIFVGSENLSMDVTLVPFVEFSTLGSIFLVYALPSIASVLIPVWRVAITDPKEAML